MSNVKSITPNTPADFTPTMGKYKDLQPFRYWCHKILPMVYDDSLSYYELLCKVVDYLNKTMEDVETLHGDVTNIRTAYEKLQGYVNEYFSALDVQEEINNKLDNMASSGELYEIIRSYTDPIVNEQNDKINVLKARMDTFASLPDGSTSGDAELLDIRVKADGTTVTSAGNAVREQFSELKSDLANFGTSINLFDYHAWKEKTSGVVNGDMVVEDYHIIMTANDYDCYSMFDKGRTLAVPVEPNTYYCFSCCCSSANAKIFLFESNNDKEDIVVHEVTLRNFIRFQTGNATTNVKIRFGVRGIGNTADFYNINFVKNEYYLPYFRHGIGDTYIIDRIKNSGVIDVTSLGAIGDGVSDDGDAIASAIKIACEYGLDVYIPSGKYLCKRTMPQIDKPITIFGDGCDHYSKNNTTIICDGDFNDYFLKFAYSNPGGGMNNLCFWTQNTNDCVYLHNGYGWDCRFYKLYFHGFKKSAITSNASDANFCDIKIIDCGKNDYAIKLMEPSNFHRFDRLHMEHCNTCVYLNGFGHTFQNCKVEISTPYNAPVIKTYENFSYPQYNCSISNCSFVALDIDAYVEELGFTTYADVPPFMDLKSAIISSSIFLCGVGSGSSITEHIGEAKYFKGDGRCVVSGNSFFRVSHSYPSIYLNDSVFSNNMLEVLPGSERILKEDNKICVDGTDNCIINSNMLIDRIGDIQISANKNDTNKIIVK